MSLQQVGEGYMFVVPLFLHNFVIMCAFLWGITDEVDHPYADRIYIYNLKLNQNYCIKSRVARY